MDPKPDLCAYQVDVLVVESVLALRMRDHLATHEFAGHRITARIGINSGPVVAGIIGRRKFSYDLWGDVVNTASRMESHGQPGAIQISAATYERIKDDFECERRGTIEIKGKGNLDAWFLHGRLTGVPLAGFWYSVSAENDVANMHFMGMHEGRLLVTAEMVRDLVGGQFPEYARLPIELVQSEGTVNAIFRIGEELATCFPLQP